MFRRILLIQCFVLIALFANAQIGEFAIEDDEPFVMATKPLPDSLIIIKDYDGYRASKFIRCCIDEDKCTRVSAVVGTDVPGNYLSIQDLERYKRIFRVEAVVNDDLLITDIKIRESFAKLFGFADSLYNDLYHSEKKLFLQFEGNKNILLPFWYHPEDYSASFFPLKKKDIKLLSTRKVQKIVWISGKLSIAIDIGPNNCEYFIKLFRMSKTKRFYNVKEGKYNTL